ncbi:MAG: ribonuclease H-like domain-containing protein, partial [Dehalococcoidia bacterium]
MDKAVAAVCYHIRRWSPVKGIRGLRPTVDAYLDIETTGLSPVFNDITVIGICLAGGDTNRFTQLVGDEATKANLLGVLSHADTIYTYNGKRFDLPFIHCRLGIDLRDRFLHHDLMHDCWRHNLFGGFKAVERRLGIPRQLRDIDGAEAVSLWWRYRVDDDREALGLLPEYNREDVVNLIA